MQTIWMGLNPIIYRTNTKWTDYSLEINQQTVSQFEYTKGIFVGKI